MAKQRKENKSDLTKPTQTRFRLTSTQLYASIIFLFSFALYFNTLFNDYNLDDELVTRNQQITSKGWNVLKFNFDAFNSVELKDSSFSQKLKYFTPVVFRVPYYQDKAGFKYEYRPLVFASFALEHALLAKTEFVNGSETESDKPFASHLINVLLYSLMCVLLFFTLKKLLHKFNPLFVLAISLLFAAFPMHTEVVASIKNRDEIMALIFGLLSLMYAIKFTENKRWINLLPTVIFFLAGILSKPTIIIFALLIPFSILVFTSSSYLRLMTITLTLAIPAALFSRLFSAAQQVELGLFLIVTTSIFYIVKNSTNTGLIIKNALQQLKQDFSSNKEPVSNESEGINFSLLKQPAIAITALISILLFSAISALGIYENNIALTVSPLFVFSIIYAFANPEIKLILVTPISLVTLFAIIRFSPSSRIIDTGLMIFLGSQIFSEHKSIRNAIVANIIIYILSSIVLLHSFHFIGLAFFLIDLKRKNQVLNGALLIISLALFIKSSLGLYHGTVKLFDGFIFWPALYCSLLILWKQPFAKRFNLSAIAIPCFLIFYFVVHYNPATTNTIATVEKIYYKANTFKALEPTPVQAVRPLKYMEYPINMTDPFEIKLGTATEVLGNYLRMVILPYPMSYYYGYSYISPKSIFDPILFLVLLVHVILFGLGLFLLNRDRIISFSILFYLLSIGIFSTLVSPVPGMLGDRFLLIPSIGLCMLVVHLFSKIFKQDLKTTNLNINTLRPYFKLSLAGLLITYSGLTFSRNRDWHDTLTLFRHDITVVENSAQAQNLLGVNLFLSATHENDRNNQIQLFQEAIPHFKKALEIYPDFLNASYDLGRSYEALQRCYASSGQSVRANQTGDSALAQFEHTVKLDTSFVAPYFNMAAIMHNKGNYAAAIPMYKMFLTQYPKQIEAYTNLSFAYFQLNNYDSSIATNRLAIINTGAPFIPTVNIAKTYGVMNQPDSALYYFELAHNMQPNDAGVNSALAQIKAKLQSKQP